MPRGRKATPAAVKRLRGNPGKRRIVVDQAPLAAGEHPPASDRDLATLRVPAPPKTLPKAARDEWNRLARHLVQMGLLRDLDLGAFAARCSLYATWLECERVKAKKGLTYEVNGVIRKRPEVAMGQDCLRQIRQYDSEFGLTPAARARVAHVTGDAQQPQIPGLDSKPAPTKGPTALGAAPPTIDHFTDDDLMRGPPN